MNKTAMQDLIDWLNHEADFFGGENDTIEDKHTSLGLRFAAEKATELLQKEKEQIMEAYKAADVGFAGKSDCEDYFTQTYQQ